MIPLLHLRQLGEFQLSESPRSQAPSEPKLQFVQILQELVDEQLLLCEHVPLYEQRHAIRL